MHDAAPKPRQARGRKSRERILGAATLEFAAKGLAGARVDEIAARAGVNKNLLYHYFGSKDDLFLAVLEGAYERFRREQGELRLGHMDPVDGMRALVEFTFDYFVAHPEFINLLNSENLSRGSHIARSERIQQMYSPLVAVIANLLRRGTDRFRPGIDPVQLYISISGLGYFYLSNIHTLSGVFGQDLKSDAAIAARRAHVVETVLAALRA